MDKLIKFKALANQISLQESKLFFVTLIDEGNLEFLIGALFEKFRAQIAKNQDFVSIEAINKTLESINILHLQNL